MRKGGDESRRKGALKWSDLGNYVIIWSVCHAGKFNLNLFKSFSCHFTVSSSETVKTFITTCTILNHSTHMYCCIFPFLSISYNKFTKSTVVKTAARLHSNTYTHNGYILSWGPYTITLGCFFFPCNVLNSVVLYGPRLTNVFPQPVQTNIIWPEDKSQHKICNYTQQDTTQPRKQEKNKNKKNLVTLSILYLYIITYVYT